MASKKDYIFAPGGLNLDWYELLQQYPDEANNCYLVALSGRQISVLLDLAGLLKWGWLWGINYHTDKPGMQAITEFKYQLEHCLMAGCEVEQLIEAVNGVRDAIAANGPDETPDLTSIEASLAQLATDFNDYRTIIPANLSSMNFSLANTLPGALSDIQDELDESLTQIDTTNTNRNDRLGDINTSLVPLGNLDQLQTLLGPLENLGNLSYLDQLTYLQYLEWLKELDGLVTAIRSIPDTDPALEGVNLVEWASEQAYFDYKCRAANWIYYNIREFWVNAALEDASFWLNEPASAIASALISFVLLGVGLATAPAIIIGALSLLAVQILTGESSFDPDDVKNLLDTHKTDFIKGMYEASDRKWAEAAAVVSLGDNLSPLETIIFGFMFTWYGNKLFKEYDDLWDDLPPSPYVPVVCSTVSGGGIPDACSSEINTYHGNDASEPTWLDGNDNIIMDTWHVFNYSYDSPGDRPRWEMDARYHVQVSSSVGGYLSYVPGDGDCTSTSLQINADQTYVFDCVEFSHIEYIVGKTIQVRFASEQG